jgi:hypothetical protein
MASARGVGVGKYHKKVSTKRPGIISKCRSSHNKQSKYYVKRYVGQGR